MPLSSRASSLVWVFLFCTPLLFAESRTIQITKPYLNLPISRASKMQVFDLKVDGLTAREIPAQLAETTPDYWVFLDVSEFKGKTITLTGLASDAALNRIEASDNIHDAASIYREPNRPQVHFSTKRGWSNDVNGPIFYHGQYHLFWQAFPFGDTWDTGFMYWGHATSKDLLHWHELAPALMVDSLGSPWSGSSFIDHNNTAGWGKDALILAYTAFDRHTQKQVQALAYSTDNAATFTRFSGNPILDTNTEVGSVDTRDPHVFWYQPTQRWVMVLFEKDGLSIFNSTDLKSWTRKSHFKGLYECPDLFELPIQTIDPIDPIAGNPLRTKWILHGGSSTYFIGAFDGERFTAESPELHYAEGKNLHGEDTLYAAQSFAEMPGHSRVQMAWGRIQPDQMPFNQIMLFPTEFKLVTTAAGLRMQASPIAELSHLHRKPNTLASPTLAQANHAIERASDRANPETGPVEIQLDFTLASDNDLTLNFEGNPLATIHPSDLEGKPGSLRILLDKGVAEIFLNQGTRYIVRELPTTPRDPQTTSGGLTLKPGSGSASIANLKIYPLDSIWNTANKKR
jgi:fructan beta-fructosidase